MLAPAIAIAAFAGGLGFSAWGAVAPSAELFGPTLRRLPMPRALALTFDDGPNPAITPALLDLLDRCSAPATFFLIGKHVRAAGALAREIAARGHALGNHTDTHPNLLWLSPRRIREELDRCQDSIGEAAGRRALWMRPPYGFRGPQLDRVVRRGGWAGVAMWSLTNYDWKPQPAERLIRRLRRARPGDIVLLHDGDHRALGGDRSHVVRALDYWLPRWRDAGIEFVTLDRLAPFQLFGAERDGMQAPGPDSAEAR
jgi:peptidoglycan-N-acetylglucosamine deacetylase